MKKFYSGGGNNAPWFQYRFKVKSVTSEMIKWSDEYPLDGPFQRYHIEWNSHRSSMPINDVVQFEDKEAATMFMLKFGEYVV